MDTLKKIRQKDYSMTAQLEQNRWHRLALSPLLAALILRLVWGVFLPIIPISDSNAYDVFAWNIAQGNGYGWEPGQATAFWPVGTSAIYGFIFWIFGHTYTPIMLLQVAIGVATVALSISLARQWFDEKVGVATGWILACWPLLIQYTTILASELYFIFFVLLAFWCASMQGKHWITKAIFSGVSLAAASYVRPLALIMAPLLFAKEFCGKKDYFKTALACTLCTIIMALCITPWAIRNWQTFNRVVLISTNGGSNLWMGNNSSGSIGYMHLPKLEIANEADADKYLGQQAKDYIVQQPGAFVLRVIKKTISLHDRETIGVVWNEVGITKQLGQQMLKPFKLVSTAYWYAILIFAIFGVFRYFRNRGCWQIVILPPAATWAYFTLVHAVTVGGDRYHLPSIPFIAVLAAYGFLQLRGFNRQ